MAQIRLTDAQRLHLAEMYGDDALLDELRIVDFRGVVMASTVTPEELALAGTATHTDPRTLFDSDGRPSILKVSAWMVHADVPNENGDAFIGEELKTLAPTIARAPHLMVMDWNHAAARPRSLAPKVVGAWYKAQYAFDPRAQQWGILVDGMVWAWLFPEQATQMLADQARDGTVAFSMAALPNAIEAARTADGRTYTINHNPKFLTVSALDVRPGDPHGRGIVTQHASTTAGTLTDLMLNGTSTSATTAVTTSNHLWVQDNTLDLSHWTLVPRPIPARGVAPIIAQDNTLEDRSMDEKMIEQLKADNAAANTKFAELTERYSVLSQDLGGMRGQLATAEAAKAELETRNAELETARTAAQTERDEAVTRVAELTGQVEELKGKLVAFEAKEAEAAAATVLAARIESLPEAFRLAHSERDEATRARVEKKWAGMTDEAWEEYKTDELIGIPTKLGQYVERTKAEGNGRLPAGGDAEPNDLVTRAKSLIK